MEVAQLATNRGLERLLDIYKKEKDKYLSGMIYRHSFQSFFSFFVQSIKNKYIEIYTHLEDNVFRTLSQ